MASGIGARWDEVLSLVPGDHIHLDELLDRPPQPGSVDWLPIIDELTRFLLDSGGHWLVSVQLGACDELPTGDLTASAARNLAVPVILMSPPAIYRWPHPSTPDNWQGEKRSWQRQTGDRVTEIVTLSRSNEEAVAGEGYTAFVSYEVGGPDH